MSVRWTGSKNQECEGLDIINFLIIKRFSRAPLIDRSIDGQEESQKLSSQITLAVGFRLIGKTFRFPMMAMPFINPFKQVFPTQRKLLDDAGH